jgi:hypothetical protein
VWRKRGSGRGLASALARYCKRQCLPCAAGGLRDADWMEKELLVYHGVAHSVKQPQMHRHSIGLQHKRVKSRIIPFVWSVDSLQSHIHRLFLSFHIPSLSHAPAVPSVLSPSMWIPALNPIHVRSALLEEVLVEGIQPSVRRVRRIERSRRGRGHRHGIKISLHHVNQGRRRRRRRRCRATSLYKLGH